MRASTSAWAPTAAARSKAPTCRTRSISRALLQKLRGDHTGWVGATDSFRCATMGGARALGRETELGADREGPHRRSGRLRPRRHAVHAAEQSGQSARLRGLPPRGRLRDGRRRGDPAARQAHARRRGPAHRRDRRGARPHRAADHRIGADVERLLPAYERIYRRCQEIAISPDTYPARFDH